MIVSVTAVVIAIACVLALMSSARVPLPDNQAPELAWTEMDPLPASWVDDTVWTGERFLITSHSHGDGAPSLLSSADGRNWAGSNPFAAPANNDGWIGGSFQLWADDKHVLAWSDTGTDTFEALRLYRSDDHGAGFTEVAGITDGMRLLPEIEGQTFRLTSAVVHGDTVVAAVDRFGGLTSDLLADSPAREFVEWIEEVEEADGYSIASPQGERLEVCRYDDSGAGEECRDIGFGELDLDRDRRELLQSVGLGGLTTLLVSTGGKPFEVISLGPASATVDTSEGQLIAHAALVSSATARVADPAGILRQSSAANQFGSTANVGLVSADGTTWTVNRSLPIDAGPPLKLGERADIAVDYDKVFRFEADQWREVAVVPGVGPLNAGPGGLFAATTVRRGWPRGQELVYGWSPDGQRWNWQRGEEHFGQVGVSTDDEFDMTGWLTFAAGDETVLAIAQRPDASELPVFAADIP